MDAGTFCFLLLILIVVIVVALWTMVVQVEQYESGVALRLGKFHTMLNPGWNFVVPLITVVYKIDLRIQVLDVPRQEVITKDNSPTMVDAVVYYRVADAKKAVLNVATIPDPRKKPYIGFWRQYNILKRVCSHANKKNKQLVGWGSDR